MAVFNCAPFENEDSVELEVTTQTGDQDTGELAVTDSLKIKGVDGVSVSVDGDTVVFGIDQETFPENPEGGGDTTELEQRVAEIEKNHTDNTNAVNYIMGLAQNPANDGKVYGIKDEEITPMDLPDSIEINEVSSPDQIPADAKEGSIWVTPKQGGGENGGENGGGLPVVELTTLITYCDENNPSTTTVLSKSEGAELSEAAQTGLPVVVKWAYDSLFTFGSLGNNFGDTWLELGFVYSNVRGVVCYNGAISGWEFRLTWNGNA